MATIGLPCDEKNRNLLGRAVHRNTAASLEGLLERLFTFAFRGLVYPQIWEDPAVDLTAMEIKPHHHIVTIASGGCNVMSYLTASPARITAVDLNRAHIALTRLKLAGALHLPGWEEYYRFFGEADEHENVRNYERYLKPRLDVETRAYWESRGWTGQRRINQFRSNIYRRGLLGRFIGLSHLLAALYGNQPRRFLECASLQEQRQFFEGELTPLLEKRFIKWITNRRVALYGLGIPPAQYEALAGGLPMAKVLHERLERLTCGFSLNENYFAWQAFGRSYAPNGHGPLPPYLVRENFDLVRQNANRASADRAPFTDALSQMPSGSVDRFVLLDAQDWMTSAQLNDLWREIMQASTPQARVIFRTAGKDTILPNRVDASLLDQWCYRAKLSRELSLRDRASIYGGFHVYERRN
jgi:S-adenosylmethionine-diacylglycerol 3-amino-3-carboxypropyl transferase